MFRKKPSPVVDVQWMIVGLGNPGPEYAGTRHNVGFMLIDQLAERHRIKLNQAKLRARLGTGVIEGVGVALVKPMTFMNASGQSVAPLARHFGLGPGRILVITDDLDLDCGRLRLRAKGSAGGHNGHRSLIQALGTQEYPRLKVGIHSDSRDETIDFVLSKFTPTERVDIDAALQRAGQGIELLLESGLERAIEFINGPAGKGSGGE